jgi:hypothetical protein
VVFNTHTKRRKKENLWYPSPYTCAGNRKNAEYEVNVRNHETMMTGLFITDYDENYVTP